MTGTNFSESFVSVDFQIFVSRSGTLIYFVIGLTFDGSVFTIQPRKALALLKRELPSNVTVLLHTKSGPEESES